MTPKELARRLISTATDYVGMRETRPNAAWDDPRTPQWDVDAHVWLRTRMRQVSGWTPGAPYCAAFVGAVVSAVLEGATDLTVRAEDTWLAHWTAHCMINANGLRQRGWLTASPVPGAIWLAQQWRRGRATSSGHTGIVCDVSRSLMVTVEGNTSSGSTDNTGDGIYTRTRALQTNGSLRTVGYLTPSDLLRLVAD
jgi:hypothetical protein